MHPVCCALAWQAPDCRPLLWLMKHELPGTALFMLVTPFLPFSFLKEQVDGAKYDYPVEYQQPPDLTGKGLCARALYDYQAGKTCRVLAFSLNCWGFAGRSLFANSWTGDITHHAGQSHGRVLDKVSST